MCLAQVNKQMWPKIHDSISMYGKISDRLVG